MLGQILEVAMLVLFGCSWPINLIKSIKTKSTKGKSLLFLILIDLGYVCGITSKFVSQNLVWWVLLIYFLNFTMVSLDLIIYIINKKRENKIQK